MVSKILTLILSFIAGIVGMIVLFYPLLFLRIPISFIERLLGFSGNGSWAGWIIVNFIVFLFIGMFISKWFQKRFLGVNVYFTIPFAFPIIFMFFEFFKGGETFVEVLPVLIAGWMPLFTYVVGLVIGKRKFKVETL